MKLMKIGYCRVSTQDQKLDLQLDALKKSGCKKIYQDKISGSKSNRPGLDNLINNLREGDTVVIYKLDRLGRSLIDLVKLVERFNELGVGLISITDNIDTTSAQGKLIFHIFCSLAEFERSLISERTKAGLTAAKARGRLGGRPKGLSKEAHQKAIICQTLYKDGKMGANEIAKQLGISKSTMYRYLKEMVGGI
jgi:DNA invertase Pin-like site-specific DNA recombinase